MCGSKIRVPQKTPTFLKGTQKIFPRAQGARTILWIMCSFWFMILSSLVFTSLSPPTGKQCKNLHQWLRVCDHKREMQASLALWLFHGVMNFPFHRKHVLFSCISTHDRWIWAHVTYSSIWNICYVFLGGNKHNKMYWNGDPENETFIFNTEIVMWLNGM